MQTSVLEFQMMTQKKTAITLVACALAGFAGAAQAGGLNEPIAPVAG